MSLIVVGLIEGFPLYKYYNSYSPYLQGSKKLLLASYTSYQNTIKMIGFPLGNPLSTPQYTIIRPQQGNFLFLIQEVIKILCGRAQLCKQSLT